jgi:hypothetical protein
MKQLARVLVCLFVAVTAAAQPVRMSWQTFAQDPARVQSFRNAVAAMRARNTADKSSAEYRTSWEYWANMHGYFGETAKNGTVAQFRAANGLTDPSFDAAFAGVENTTPPDAIAQAVWDQCQHRTVWFFPWHRLYLYYFEQVLQDAAGDPTLRLPYWDYTEVANLGMPAEFTTPTYVNAQGQTVPNPLYEPRRMDGWNVPSTNTLDPVATDIDQALDIAQLLDTTSTQGTVKGYQGTIEQTPHGDVHCAVMQCRATVMGAVSYSSNDPIFYLHHCNIDRLWQCWQSISGHQDPQGSWRTQEFSYVNRIGNLVKNEVADLFNGSLIDYVYDHPSNCTRDTPQVTLLRDVPPAKGMVKPGDPVMARARTMLARPVLIGETGATRIEGMVTRKRVSLPATATLAHPRQFALRGQSDLPVATDLILRGVRFRQHPGARVRVFLERTDRPSVRAQVGTMSFFSQEPVDSRHAHHTPTEDTFRFDATDALRALRLEGTGRLDVHVVFEVVDERLGPDFDAARTGLTIDEIELHVRRDL